MNITQNGWIGALLGGVLGGVGAHFLSGGKASLVEMALGAGGGAVAGGFVGNAIPVTTTPALAPTNTPTQSTSTNSLVQATPGSNTILSISSSQTLTVQTPSGSTITSASAEDGTAGSISGSNAFFNNLSVGGHTVTINWTDSSNASQTSTVSVTVTQ